MKKINKTRLFISVLFIMALVASSALLWSCGDGGEALGSGGTSFKLEITDAKGDEHRRKWIFFNGWFNCFFGMAFDPFKEFTRF